MVRDIRLSRLKPPGGGGGGGLGSNYARMCVSKSEMSENISLKMGIEYGASQNMGGKLCRVLFISICKSDRNMGIFFYQRGP